MRLAYQTNPRRWASTALVVFLVAVTFTAPSHSASAQTAQELYEAAEKLRLEPSGEADLQQALDFYQQAAALGKNASLFRMGTIHQTLGNAESAMSAFQRATERGSGSAAIALAEGHARGSFGALSDRTLGVPVLERLVSERDISRAAFVLAQLYENGVGTDRDVGKAVSIYSALAEKEYPNALRKLGRLHLYGDSDLGTARDLNKAISLLRRGIDAGSDGARRDYGLALMQAGRPQEAINALSEAADAGVNGAAADLANGHYRTFFGALSDKRKGARMLQYLAESGDVYAIRHALRHHERKSRRLTGMDLPVVLGSLETQTDEGSGFAAKILARAYRKLRFLIPGNRDKLAKLVTDHPTELGPEALAAEKVSVLYDRNDHAASRAKTVEYLETLDGTGFAKGALRLRSIEPQAFVFLLQRQLKERGLYQGPLSGVANRSTIRAVLAYCRQQGYFDTCIHGPINFESASLVMQSLEES